MHGKRVRVRIERLRFRCKACGRTLFEPVPAMDDKPQATKRLIGHGEAHRSRKTCAELPREVGVDDKTARHIFDDDVARRSARVRFDTPEVLGIDELKIVGQYRAVLTNVDRLRLFDMLPTRKKADLVADFKRMPDKRRVKLLTTDRWSVYRQVVLDQFPGTPIVADRCHVVRMANDALERVRKSVRQGLTMRERLWLKDDRLVLTVPPGQSERGRPREARGAGREIPAAACGLRGQGRLPRDLFPSLQGGRPAGGTILGARPRPPSRERIAGGPSGPARLFDGDFQRL